MAPRTPPAQAFDRQTQDLVVSVPARLSRLHQSVLSGLDPRLTFRQYRTLSRVAGGYTSLSQLAARANLSLPTVSENVDGLVRRGLLSMTQSAVDRRANLLSITEAGLSAVKAADKALEDMVAYLLADVSETDLPVLTRALQSMYDRATAYISTDEKADRT